MPASVALRAKQVYWAERDDEDQPMRFRQFLEQHPGEPVVLVDDILRSGSKLSEMKVLLESRGAKVSTVSSASEALEAISRQRPDVFLADLRMPGEDGYSLIRKLRASERGQETGRLAAIAVVDHKTRAGVCGARTWPCRLGADASAAMPAELIGA